MKKAVKVVLLILIIIWIGLELLNFGSYIYYKNFKNGKRCDFPMPSCYVHYRPLFVGVSYSLFPSLNPNDCKDCNY